MLQLILPFRLLVEVTTIAIRDTLLLIPFSRLLHIGSHTDTHTTLQMKCLKQSFPIQYSSTPDPFDLLFWAESTIHSV